MIGAHDERRCTVCDEWVHVESLHWPHRDDCAQQTGEAYCSCDDVTCCECCWDPRCCGATP